MEIQDSSEHPKKRSAKSNWNKAKLALPVGLSLGILPMLFKEGENDFPRFSQNPVVPEVRKEVETALAKDIPIHSLQAEEPTPESLPEKEKAELNSSTSEETAINNDTPEKEDFRAALEKLLQQFKEQNECTEDSLELLFERLGEIHQEHPFTYSEIENILDTISKTYVEYYPHLTLENITGGNQPIEMANLVAQNMQYFNTRDETTWAEILHTSNRVLAETINNQFPQTKETKFFQLLLGFTIEETVNSVYMEAIFHIEEAKFAEDSSRKSEHLQLAQNSIDELRRLTLTIRSPRFPQILQELQDQLNSL